MIFSKDELELHHAFSSNLTSFLVYIWFGGQVELSYMVFMGCLFCVIGCIRCRLVTVVSEVMFGH